MDLVSSINQIKPVIEKYQKFYPSDLASMNDLYYNHAFEVLGMIASNNIDISKLPNPQPDMVEFNRQIKQTVPQNQQLFEYVVTNDISFKAAHELWNDLCHVAPILSQLPLGTRLMLTKLVIPTFRQVLVKRSMSSVPVLYAPNLTLLFQDLKALNDPHMVVELWTEMQFQRVDGHQLFLKLVSESDYPSMDLKGVRHLQTMDDLSLRKRFVLPTQMTNQNGQSSRHVFDAILNQAPGNSELSLMQTQKN